MYARGTGKSSLPWNRPSNFTKRLANDRRIHWIGAAGLQFRSDFNNGRSLFREEWHCVTPDNNAANVNYPLCKVARIWIASKVNKVNNTRDMSAGSSQYPVEGGSLRTRSRLFIHKKNLNCHARLCSPVQSYGKWNWIVFFLTHSKLQ